MKVLQRRKWEWSIIIFILPLGVAMMMCVGQLAIRMAPTWTLDGEMNSSIDPESAPKQNALIVPPISNGILTPVSWWDTFLTPSGDSDGAIVFPPFITFEPSLTPSITITASETSVSPTASATPSLTTTPTPPTGTPTKKPTTTITITTTSTATATGTATATATAATCTDPLANNNGGSLPCVYTPTPPTTCTDPLANNNGGSLPCVYTPTPPTTCTDPLANNNGGSLPCIYTPTPPPTCTNPAANNNGGPLPCIFPVTSTPAGSPTAIPPQTTIGTPDGNVGGIPDNTYMILDLTLSGTPIVVTNPSETNYDLVYYERSTAGGVDMDSVIVSISMDNIVYYVVFHWGNGVPDNNSNVGDVVTNTGTENDNQHIDGSELHDPDGAGSSPATGILIDVDNASSNPPPGDYWYIAIQAPSPAPGNDGADVDSVQIAENTPVP